MRFHSLIPFAICDKLVISPKTEDSVAKYKSYTMSVVWKWFGCLKSNEELRVCKNMSAVDVKETQLIFSRLVLYLLSRKADCGCILFFLAPSKQREHKPPPR